VANRNDGAGIDRLAPNIEAAAGACAATRQTSVVLLLLKM
jgi:hypothetical protein